MLQQDQAWCEGLAQRGELALSVIEVGEAERRHVDAGDGKALYRVPLLVQVMAHPTKMAGTYRAHTAVLLQRHGDGWQVSQLHTVLEGEVEP